MVASCAGSPSDDGLHAYGGGRSRDLGLNMAKYFIDARNHAKARRLVDSNHALPGARFVISRVAAEASVLYFLAITED
jgi:hypothetical protein